MKLSDLTFQHVLTEFISNYIDKKLNAAELRAFNSYLDQYPEQREYLRQVKNGKKALEALPEIKAADDFEEKLFERIAGEKAKSSVKEDQKSTKSVFSIL